MHQSQKGSPQSLLVRLLPHLVFALAIFSTFTLASPAQANNSDNGPSLVVRAKGDAAPKVKASAGKKATAGKKQKVAATKPGTKTKGKATKTAAKGAGGSCPVIKAMPDMVEISAMLKTMGPMKKGGATAKTKATAKKPTQKSAATKGKATSKKVKASGPKRLLKSRGLNLTKRVKLPAAAEGRCYTDPNYQPPSIEQIKASITASTVVTNAGSIKEFMAKQFFFYISLSGSGLSKWLEANPTMFHAPKLIKMTDLKDQIPTDKDSLEHVVFWINVSEAVSYLMEGQKNVKLAVGAAYEPYEQEDVTTRKFLSSFWYLYEVPILEKLASKPTATTIVFSKNGGQMDVESVTFNLADHKVIAE
ncbi:hypothetical protein DFH27DRAFT_600245 [Peziza echinospora]|nr:hypothetical protein DFH27DRAFT_600245 [Peziza echinospora]